MSHLTNKKRKEREANARLRGFNGFNTGTRTMKTVKDYKRIKIWRSEDE